jgi:glycosyltransferase involved in cell wall biosynthesis
MPRQVDSIPRHKRILVAADLYWPPTIMGGPITARRWSDRLAARGHDVTVLVPAPGAPGSPGAPGAEAAGGPRLLRFAAGVLPHWRRDVAAQLPILPRHPWRDVREAFDRVRPEVVHVHFVTPLGMVVAREARRRRVPILGTNHALPEQAIEVYGRWVRTATPRLYRALERLLWWHIVRFYNGCSAMTAPTSAALATYRQRGIVVPSEVVSNGIELNRLAAPLGAAEREAFLARHGVPPGRRIVLYAGRTNPEKRLDVLLDAFARLPATANAHLVLTGGPTSLSTALVAARGLGERVTITGILDIEELPAAYRSADLLAHASEVEAQGIALLEAMAAGLPVVAAAAGAVSETVAHEESGLLVPVGDAAAMAAAITRVLTDEPLRRRLGAEARRRAAAHDVERSVARIEQLLVELAGATATAGAG